MKHQLLPKLLCPLTRTRLRLEAFRTVDEAGLDGIQQAEVVEGVLIGESGTVFPILDGVPRLIEGALRSAAGFRKRWRDKLAPIVASNARALDPPTTAFSRAILPTLRRFETEWSRHDLAGNTWGFDQEERVAHLLHYTGTRPADLNGKWLLDAGAGTGQLTASYASLGCEVVGVDLQPAIARTWPERNRWAGSNASRVHFVQGDLLAPPFREQAFDVVHSSGVLHHTPSTQGALASVSRVVRRGGILAVWLYKPIPPSHLPLVPGVRSPSFSVSVSWLRKYTPQLPPGLLYFMLYAYVALFQCAYRVNSVVRGRAHSQTSRERLTSLYDTLAPPYVWRHTAEEVMGWFRELGFHSVRDTSLPADPYGFSVRGVRGP